MGPIPTLTQQRVVSHAYTLSRIISRTFKAVSAPTYSTLDESSCLPTSILPPLSTTQQAIPPRIIRAGYNTFRTRISCFPISIATFTSTSRVLRTPNMATDGDYMDFLNKANEDPSTGSAKAQSLPKNMELKAADEGVDVPPALVTATRDAFYVSDSDEPFVPVSLAWEKGTGLPDEEEIAKLVEHWNPTSAEVEILDPIDWDRNGQYTDIVEAVRKAGKGNDVRVYRIAKDGSRVEYFVVTRQGDGKDARLVGVKALAIES